MARLTKAEKSRLAIEQAEFEIVANLARFKGYQLYRMMALHPYEIRRDQIGPAACDGTLAEIAKWLEAN